MIGGYAMYIAFLNRRIRHGSTMELEWCKTPRVFHSKETTASGATIIWSHHPCDLEIALEVAYLAGIPLTIVQI